MIAVTAWERPNAFCRDVLRAEVAANGRLPHRVPNAHAALWRPLA